MTQTRGYFFAFPTWKKRVRYRCGMTPARKDLLTSETDTRSLPARYANMISRQSKLRLSAETMIVLVQDGIAASRTEPDASDGICCMT